MVDLLGIYEDAVNLLPDFVTQNIGAIGAGVGGAALGAATAATVLKVSGGGSTSKKKTKKKSTKKKKKSTKRRKRKGRYTPHTAGRGKDRSTKRIRYTKNGQPYVLMRSGKARFIKKTSAKRSHRKKGGRY